MTGSPAWSLRQAWRAAAAAVIEAAIPADTTLPESWVACAALLPHALAVLDPTSWGMPRIALYLRSSGSYPAARDLVQLIADAYREDDARGPEHRDTLTARGNLADWTGQAGDAAGARDQLAALLPTFERVLGPEHPHTLTTRGNLAAWSGEAEDAADGELLDVAVCVDQGAYACRSPLRTAGRAGTLVTQSAPERLSAAGRAEVSGHAVVAQRPGRPPGRLNRSHGICNIWSGMSRVLRVLCRNRGLRWCDVDLLPGSPGECGYTHQQIDEGKGEKGGPQAGRIGERAGKEAA